jgi:hypothetical protein
LTSKINAAGIRTNTVEIFEGYKLGYSNSFVFRDWDREVVLLKRYSSDSSPKTTTLLKRY